MTKEELRLAGIAKLKKLPAKKRQQKEALISQLLYASQMWKNARTIGLIRAIDWEFDTEKIFERGFSEGKQMVVPKVFPQRKMHFFAVDPTTTYTCSKFGVEEPDSQQEVASDQIDLLIVPGIVFSSQGYRIGFGGGFYDRFLADFTGQTVSLVFAEQFDDRWQPDNFDIPVQRLITDSKKSEVNP